MFGCFHYDARVVLADGSTEKIGKIVNQRHAGRGHVDGSRDRRDLAQADRRVLRQRRDRRVASVRGRRRRRVGHPEVRLHSQPPDLHARGREAGGGDRGGRRGPRRRQALRPARGPAQADPGSLLGDGSLRFASDHNAAFRVGHGEAARVLRVEARDARAVREQDRQDGQRHRLRHDPHAPARLAPRGRLRRPTGSDVSDELIEQLDERAIAAWYCDDGSFSGNYERWGHGKAVIYCTA